MEKYATLINVVNRTLKEAVDKKVFKLGDFYKSMEAEFLRWGFRDKDSGGVDNILLVRLDSVGDFVLTSAAIREVRMNYPYAHITLVVSNRAHSLAEFCPYVNEVLSFNIEFNINNITEILYRVGVFARKHLWRRQFRLAFTFRYFSDWYILQLFMIYLSGARIRVGYNRNAGLIYTGRPPSNKTDISHKLLTHSIPASIETIHDCERSLYLLKAFGLHVNHTETELWYSASNVFDAKYYLKDFAPGRIKVLAGIGASHPVNLYPIEKYLTVFRTIIDKGGAVVIAGGSQDMNNAKFLMQNLPQKFVKNLIEVKPNWRMTAAVIAQMDMYLGNDTGMAHCAAAAHLPVIVLNRVAKHKAWHSTGNDEIYAPWQTPAIIVRPDYQLEDCQENPNYAGCMKDKAHCITQVKPEEFIAAYDKMVDLIQIIKR